MNADAWHTESLRCRAAVGLFGGGAFSCVVDASAAGFRGLVRMLNPLYDWRLPAVLIVAALIMVGIARRNSWAEGAGLLVAVGAAILGVRFIYQMHEATAILADDAYALPLYVVPVVAGRKLAFAASAALLLVGQQPGKRRVIAGAVCALMYVALVVLDNTLPVSVPLSVMP